jgi:hypothetical protein
MFCPASWPSSGATCVVWRISASGEPARQTTASAVPRTTSSIIRPWITSVQVMAIMPPMET